MASSTSDPSVTYAYLTAALVAVGLVINVGSLVILSYRKKKSMFHTLLKFMAGYDLLVLLGCLCLYSLPDLWPLFARAAYPHFVAHLLPVVQISMMTSIYCTIVMSFERYIRICHLCQLKNTKVLTEDNFWVYIACVLVFPVLFYLPKFFEVRTEEVARRQRFTLNCTQMRHQREEGGGGAGGGEEEYLISSHTTPSLSPFASSLDAPELDLSPATTTTASPAFVKRKTMASANSSSTSSSSSSSSDNNIQDPPYSPLCLRFNFTRNDTMIRILKRRIKVLEIRPTALRENALYYKVYCIGLNTTFASLIPLLSLIYLNIATVLALRQMAKTLKASDAESVVTQLPPLPPSGDRFNMRRKSHHLSLMNVNKYAQEPTHLMVPESREKAGSSILNYCSNIVVEKPSSSATGGGGVNSADREEARSDLGVVDSSNKNNSSNNGWLVVVELRRSSSSADVGTASTVVGGGGGGGGGGRDGLFSDAGCQATPAMTRSKSDAGALNKSNNPGLRRFPDDGEERETKERRRAAILSLLRKNSNEDEVEEEEDDFDEEHFRRRRDGGGSRGYQRSGRLSREESSGVGVGVDCGRRTASVAGAASLMSTQSAISEDRVVTEPIFPASEGDDGGGGRGRGGGGGGGDRGGRDEHYDDRMGFGRSRRVHLRSSTHRRRMRRLRRRRRRVEKWIAGLSRKSEEGSRRGAFSGGGGGGGVSVSGGGQSLRGRQNSVMRRQENRLTRISLSIVSLFVACHAWRLVPTAYEAFYAATDHTTVLRRWPDWLVHVNHVSHTLIVFNSAVNFLLYVLF